MNFVYLRSSRLHFFQIWALIHALATRERKKGGEKLHCMPRTYSSCQGGVCAFPLHFWSLGASSVWENLCDRFWKLVWPDLEQAIEENQLDQFWKLVGPVLAAEHAQVQGECALAKGDLHMCRGSSFVSFTLVALVVCALCLSLFFVSVVLSHCPCLRGPRLSSFKWSCTLPLFGFQSLVRVSLFVSFLFPFLFGYQMCVLAMHSSRGDWEHVWFEDRWMVVDGENPST
jgi:hypothetical protein